MPLYEYQCMECGEIFEILHKVDEKPPARCPKCQGPAKRILSPSNFILKGSGFYVNDYPSEARKKTEATESTEKKPEKPPPPKEQKAEAQA
jgi:putative FmdB family regulatory protein